MRIHAAGEEHMVRTQPRYRAAEMLLTARRDPAVPARPAQTRSLGVQGGKEAKGCNSVTRCPVRPQLTRRVHALPTSEPPLLAVRPTEMHKRTKTRPKMFTADLRVTAPNWEQPQRPAAGDGKGWRSCTQNPAEQLGLADRGCA